MKNIISCKYYGDDEISNLLLVLFLGAACSSAVIAQEVLPSNKGTNPTVQNYPNTRGSNTVRGSASNASPRPAAIAKINAPLALYSGQVLVLEQSGVERVAIGNGGLLTATVVADKQIVLLGEGVGTTTLYVWLRNGNQISYEVTVSAGSVSSKTLQDLRRLLMNEPGIKVDAVGDKLVIDGAYANQESAEKIQKIVKIYPQVLNLIRDRPEELTVLPEQMVQLDVKVIEVRKQALDDIGIKWSNLGINGPSFATAGYLYADTASFRGPGGNPGYPVTSSGRPFVSYFGLATQIGSTLNFLEKNGDSWTLAEPRVSTISGGSSKVQVGGEIPIPVATGLGQVSVVYKQYGVILEFKPVVDKSGNVRSTIVAEVSQPDRSNGSGQFVAFTNNRTETEVSLKENETLVISGLLRNIGSRNREGIPVIGRVPVLGRLFSTQEFNNEQLETLVVVTPRLHKASTDQGSVLAGQAAYARLNAVKASVEEKLNRKLDTIKLDDAKAKY